MDINTSYFPFELGEGTTLKHEVQVFQQNTALYSILGNAMFSSLRKSSETTITTNQLLASEIGAI